MTARYVNVAGSAVRLDQQWWARPALPFSDAATVTANASAHTKGAWVEVIASTSTAIDRLDLSVAGVGNSSTNTSTLLDVAIGSAGSEVVVIPNVAVGGAVSGVAGDNALAFSVPVYIPVGSRIAVRIQSLVTGGKTAVVKIGGGVGARPSGTSTSVTALGTSTSTSGGTAMSAVTNTYVELAASTAAAYEAIVAIPSVASTSISAAGRRIVVAVGASGAEVDVGEFDFVTTAQELLIAPGLDKLIPVAVPAGSRISARVAPAAAGIQLTLIGVQTLGV